MDFLVIATLGSVGGIMAATALDLGPLFVPLGAALGVFAGPLVVLAVLTMCGYIGAWFTGHPQWPPCACCGSTRSTLEWRHGHLCARFACGRRYVRRGRQCLQVLPGGASRPYLRWRFLRGWVDDPAPHAPPVAAPYRE